MFKNSTFALLIAVVSATTFVSCSSDTIIEQRQTLTNYQINPPEWLYGTWQNSDSIQFTFTTANIQYSTSKSDTWRYQYDRWVKYINNKECKFYDKVITATHYEAEYLYFEGIVVANIKVDKTEENTIDVEYTDYDGLGNIYSVGNYVLIKANE